MLHQFKLSTNEPRRLDERAIEWEQLPSLAHLVKPAGGEAPAWAETRPAGLGDYLADAEAAFVEPLPGLAVHETSEPEIFRLFFGRPPLGSLLKP